MAPRNLKEEVLGHSEGLLMCAQREDEIADTVEGLYPIDEAVREKIGPRVERFAVQFQVMRIDENLGIAKNAHASARLSARGNDMRPLFAVNGAAHKPGGDQSQAERIGSRR